MSATTYSSNSTTAGTTKPLDNKSKTTSPSSSLATSLSTSAIAMISIVFGVPIVIAIILSHVLCMGILKYKSLNRIRHIHQLVEENGEGGEVPYENMCGDEYPVRFVINDALVEEAYEDPTSMIIIPSEDSKEKYINLKPGNIISMINNSAYSSVANH